MTDADPKNGLSSRSAGDSPVLAWARRRAPTAVPGNTVSDLLAGRNDSDIATRRGLPLATVMGVRSFYDQIEPGPRVCDGTACHFEGGRTLEAHLAPCGPLGAVRCLGHCYGAPAFQTGAAVFARPRDESLESWLAGWGEDGSPAPDLLPIPRHSLAEVPVVLRHLLRGAATQTFDEYELPDGEAILRALEAAHLRGRGGASYPTAAKWRAARDTPADERFVVANGDEGDPGSFVDRLLLEEDPHAILAGMVACARVTGARRGIVYIRAEYPRAQLVMGEAIRAARGAGALGGDFDVEVVPGGGSYVCGEETAMLRSIEGLRGEPRPKPPYPAQSGLHGHPTVVQNVETLALVPWIVRHARPIGTKAVSLSGALRHTCVVEVPLGMPLRRVLEQAGGGPLPKRGWRMALIGGPMGRVVPEHEFDTPLSYEGLPGLGARRGRGARRERHSARARRAPVRVRARRVVRLLHAVPRGDRAARRHARRRGAQPAARDHGDREPVRFRPGRAATDPRPARALRRRGVRMSVRVDDGRVPALGTVLEACRAAGAEVPAFCHDDRLSVGGHCRSCMVEVDGRMVAACCTPSREGATVVTKSDRLREYRRDLGELMLSESAPAGPVGVTLSAWGADGSRYGRPERHPRRDASHPYLRIDLDHCILCRRCVRACEEIQGQFVYGIEGRGAEARLAWGTERFAESPCVSCGACVTACPTDALTDVDRLAPRAHPPAATSVTRTTCGYCGVGCQLDAHAASGTIARIEGASEAAVNHGHLCVKGRYAHGFVRHRDRLTTPLIRRGGRLERADWDEAIAVVARELMARRGHVAGLSSSRCTNEENYLFQKWLRAGLGTNDVDCCARVCHAPSAVGMRAAFGTGAATNSLDDIERADLLLVIGANITEAHPVTGARIKRAAIGGAPLVVVDPRRTELAAVADVHLQLRPGTNVPLLNAFACALVEEDLVDREFIAARVEGWAEFEPFIRRHTPELAASVTGVPAEKIREAARLYGRAARPMTLHGLGVTEHLQGSEAVMLICNLALLTGALGRAGVGVNPLRGQNNVQGAADMGCAPDYLPGYQLVADPESRARFEAVWGRALPTTAGRTIPAMYDAVCAGDIRAMVVFGEDVVQTDPNTDRVRETLAKLEFLVVQELFLSETAELAHVVLPGASFLEKDGTFTNGERRIQRVRAVVPPTPEHAPTGRSCSR